MLKLSGIIDIFEAASLHTDAVATLNQPQSNCIHVDLSHVERLDVTAYQTLRSLCRTAEANGKSVTIDVPAALAAQLERMGMAL